MVMGTDRMRGDEMGVDGPPGGALDSPGDEDLGGAGSDAAHTAHTAHPPPLARLQLDRGVGGELGHQQPCL